MTPASDFPGQRTVLIVDDESTVRMALACCFEWAGFLPVMADSGAAALGLFEAKPITVAFVDVHMPAMTGFACAAALHARAATLGRHLDLWLMTGTLTKRCEARASEVGARGILHKPFKLEAVLGLLGVKV